ncbi:hypothetical protein L1887_43319 [Cichorium endivia]|nr:hypothetical protein L1887_43319 [Cichorium endivia]
MIGRADIEGSKSNVAMNAWLPQASYPCGNFSDTSSFKFRRSKGSLGHAFTVRIRTGNQNQTSFYPSVPHEISVLVELILGHLRYLLTDVPPQPNSPPDNVFRPDRPAEAGLGSKKRGIAPLPIHGISKITRIPLVRTSSELAVRRPGKAPEGAVPSPSPGRHAATRSRRGSSSSSPPTADGFGTGTPVPSPQSQSFSRGYGSILPTSLAYIVPSTRGCSPWRPDAVMSTTGRGRHSVLRIFKGRRGRTGHRATCGALPAAGPYLRLSHPHRRPLRPGSRPRFCSDRRALLLIGAWHLPRRPGVGRALKRHPFSGLVDSAGMLTLEPFSEDQGRSAVHPARGIPPISFLAPCGFTHPLTRTHVRLLGPCFKTGRMGCPQAGAGSTQTAPRGATGSGHDGALTLSGAPFQGTWARSAAEDASPDYNSDSEAVRFSSWADPGSLAVTKGILVHVHGSFCFAGFDNDPSAGSPTETLLRLLLPLNDKVQWNSRDVAGGEPPTSPRS